jgi:hypothetical protein
VIEFLELLAAQKTSTLTTLISWIVAAMLIIGGASMLLALSKRVTELEKRRDADAGS